VIQQRSSEPPIVNLLNIAVEISFVSLDLDNKRVLSVSAATMKDDVGTPRTHIGLSDVNITMVVPLQGMQFIREMVCEVPFLLISLRCKAPEIWLLFKEPH
jgi:hypothetical protein